MRGQTALQPQKFYGQGLSLSNDIAEEGVPRIGIPIQNQTALIGAQTALATAPYDSQAQEAGAIGNLYQAEHPLIGANPFTANVNINPNATTDGLLGTITPGHYMPKLLCHHHKVCLG